MAAENGTNQSNADNTVELGEVANTEEESRSNNCAEESGKPKGWFSKLWQQCRPSVRCPGPLPSRLMQLAFIVVVLCVTMGALVSLLGAPAIPPDGGIFQLLMLFLVADLMGKLISLIRLPPLLGMLITGIALRNIGVFQMEGGYLQTVSSLRLCAMVVILIKAGVGLDAQALKRLSCVVLRLAMCPCIIEAVSAMCAAHLLLRMPWIWGILLGCVLAAVSPAVVVPSLLSLKERGYGEDKGISTLVIAASSIDDIAAISAFGVFLGIIFSEGSLTQQILQGPLEVLIGITFGLFYGILLIYIPHANDEKLVAWRATLLGSGSILAVFGSQRIGFAGAGPLGCITAAFVASCGWKAEIVDSANKNVSVEPVYSELWKIFQPLLFGLIGTEIVIAELNSNTVLLGLCVVIFALLFRITTVGVITMGGLFTWKERIFIAIAWLPKATVQAALAPVALDIARQNNAPEEIILLAEQVLTIAVLAILVTAPIGAIGISFTGPRLLSKPVQ